MVDREKVETNLKELLKQQQETSARMSMLEGAIQFARFLLVENPETPDAPPAEQD